MDKFLELINEINTVIKKYQEKLNKEQKKFASLESQERQIEEDLKANAKDIKTCGKNIKVYQHSEYILKHPIEGLFLCEFTPFIGFTLLSLVLSLILFIVYLDIIALMPVLATLVLGVILGFKNSIKEYNYCKKYLADNTLEQLNSDLEQAKNRSLELSQEKEKIKYNKINSEVEIAALQKAISEETEKLKKVKDLRVRALVKILENKFEPQLNALFKEDVELKLILEKKEGGK